MPRKNEDLQRHTLYLRVGDYEKLQSLFPAAGAAPVIRQIVASFVDRCEQSTSLPEVKVEF